MDQAAQALSNILGSALDEIREELNELKQSNTAVTKRSEALEAAYDQSTGVIVQLQKALNDTLSHAQAARAAYDRNSTLNQQLWESFAEVRGQVEAQSMTNSYLTVSLAEARNEVAAVKLLLDAMGSGQSTSQTIMSSEPAKQKGSAVEEDYVMVDQNDAEEENYVGDLNNTTQQTPAFALVSAKRPQFIRETSVESSMTFCNAEQSAVRREQRAMGLFDRAIHLPLGLQSLMPRPEEIVLDEDAPKKKRKTITSEAHFTPNGNFSDHTFLVPPLPLRPSSAEAKKSSVSESIGQLPGVAVASSDLATRTENVDMEDTIIVAPRNARTAFTFADNTGPSRFSASPTMSQFGKIADIVLQDFDVDPLVQEPLPPSRFLTITTGHTAVREPVVPASTTRHDGHPRLRLDSTAQDPDIIDLDSGLRHQPQNRGENDQTGVAGERRYQTLRIHGEVYTVDRSQAHANNIQAWKSWSVRRPGGWIQWTHYASLDWTNQSEVDKMNKWRYQSLTRVGFPQMRKKKRVDYSAEEKDWLFEHVKAAGGDRPNISMLELTRRFNERFGDTRMELGIQSAVDRLRGEYARCNGQRRPTRERGRLPQATSPFSRGEVFDSTGDGVEQRITPSHSKDVPPNSITRTALLSQFQARTGEMQKSREQSQESNESKHDEQR